MKKYQVKHVHFQNNGLSGIVGFLVDNRLFNFKFITPAYNDYFEFRILSAAISSKAYQPKENDFELTPSQYIPDFEITQKELDFLDLYFEYSYVSKYKYQTHEKNDVIYDNRNIDQNKLNDYINKYSEYPVFPFDYLNPDEFCCATLLDLNKPERNKCQDFLTLFVPIKRNKCEYFDSDKINISDWKDVDDITKRLGLFNLFIPTLNGILKESK